MERSFKTEIESLKLGEGEVFQGEGILAVTKALLQSGVSYVGGYQGAPVSHLIDVLSQATELMSELGVHVEMNTNEASAAAMLGASISYPVRGAVTWKSIVGTNVAADALSNLSSPGVMGGALIVVGDDYGEGASVIQERTHSFALKSSMWLLDPRPNLESIVNMVENGFQLSEISNTPVILELRIRACHIQGEFIAKDNIAPKLSSLHQGENPADFLYSRLSHPPVTFIQEKHKVEHRLPAARKFIIEQRLNEFFEGDLGSIGIVLQGGLYNSLMRRLSVLGLADVFGETRIPLYVLNVVHPLVPEEILQFCEDKKAILVLEEGNPEFIEQQINVFLRQANRSTQVLGKDVLPMAGEYTAEALLKGVVGFLEEVEPDGLDIDKIRDIAASIYASKEAAQQIFEEPLPPRPPGFCTGCPERPVFSAIKLLKEEFGNIHISTDIGCHSFATFPPFNLGNSILGYGMSLAASAGVSSFQKKRTISVMGDGGFWHNGLQTGVLSSLFNKNDSILVIMQNGYSAATGQQYLPSTATKTFDGSSEIDIEEVLKTLKVGWIKKVRTYSVTKMVETFREAMTTSYKGLKVIIADGECMLARQRRIKAENRGKLADGKRVSTPRFGVDEEICSGDHSCIRLSGCPSLTIKENPDFFRDDPITGINNDCVGCSLCGEVAHAAALCPAFYEIEKVQNPNLGQRFLSQIRNKFVNWLASESPRV